MKKFEWIWSLLDKNFFHLSPSDLLGAYLTFIVYIAIVYIGIALHCIPEKIFFKKLSKSFKNKSYREHRKHVTTSSHVLSDLP